MKIKEITAKSILRKQKKIDSWFISRYGMNLYRGCVHDCAYCDGRAEKYQVDGVFGSEVAVKINAPEILRKELTPSSRKKPLKKAFVILGGGVGDVYQPAEEQYGLSRQVLEILYEFDLPVHVLTKSTLVERDLDLLSKINKKNRAMVSFSFSSVDDRITSLFEPGIPLPGEKLALMQRIKAVGIPCGVFMLPVLPFISDTELQMEGLIKTVTQFGADYIVFGGLTLKTGRQKDFYMELLKNHHPSLVPAYESIYHGGKWGEADSSYYSTLHKRFYKIIKKYSLPARIPADIFRGVLDEEDLVVVILEHIDWLLGLKGEKSTYGYSAYRISQCNDPLRSAIESSQKIQGVSDEAMKIIQEILVTGTSELYEKLIKKR